MNITQRALPDGRASAPLSKLGASHNYATDEFARASGKGRDASITLRIL